MKNCSHGDSDDMSCAYDQAKLRRGKYSDVVSVQKDKYFKVVPNVDKHATCGQDDRERSVRFIEANPMNNGSHGDSDDMSCAYDQAKLRRSKTSEVVRVQKGNSFKVVPEADQQAASEEIQCAPGTFRIEARKGTKGTSHQSGATAISSTEMRHDPSRRRRGAGPISDFFGLWFFLVCMIQACMVGEHSKWRESPSIVQSSSVGEHCRLRDTSRTQHRNGRHPKAIMIGEHSIWRESPSILVGEQRKLRDYPSMNQNGISGGSIALCETVQELQAATPKGAGRTPLGRIANCATNLA